MENPYLTSNPFFTGQALQAWKTQFDTALKLVETLTEGAMKMHETQLEAATDAHANAAATRQSITAAAGPIELAQAGTQWLQHNGEHAAAYWRALFQVALETNASLMKCVSPLSVPGLPASGAPLDVDASKNALLGMVDNAYKQWLENTRRLYGAHAE
jgi:hypothetical protein